MRSRRSSLRLLVSTTLYAVLFFSVTQGWAATAQVGINGTWDQGFPSASVSISGRAEGAANFGPNPSMHLNGGNYEGWASLKDYLTFSNIPEGEYVTVTVHMGGNWTLTSPSDDSSRVDFSLYLGSTVYLNGMYSTGSPYGDDGGIFEQKGWSGDTRSGIYYIDQNWTVTNGTYRLQADLHAVAGDKSSAYIDDPITFDLPEGVTFTSDSGSTYSTTGASVPAPATMLLLGTGLVGIAGIRRRIRN